VKLKNSIKIKKNEIFIQRFSENINYLLPSIDKFIYQCSLLLSVTVTIRNIYWGIVKREIPLEGKKYDRKRRFFK